MLRMASNFLRGRVPAYTRKPRHLQLLLRHARPAKLLNLAFAELSLARGDTVSKARPYIYTVDTGNLCNLRCPLCPTGYRGLHRPQALMTLSTFEEVLRKIRPFAIEVILHNWGEPFLNPDILQMVRATKEAGIGTTISSNLNLVNRGREFLQDVVDSGLEHLTVSLDGTTQEVYEQYRRGGEIEEVFDNLRFLLDYRRRTGLKTPVIEWQYLVMRHNQHQMAEAQRLANEMGVDRLRFASAGLPFDELANVEMAEPWLSDLPRYRNYDPQTIRSQGYLYDERCFYLYRAMTINPRGEVSPCCAVYHGTSDFGNLVASDLDQVWNNEHYRVSRALFSGKPYPSDLKTVCSRCPLFKFEGKAFLSRAAAI